MSEIKLIVKDTYYYILSKFFPGVAGLAFLLIFTRIVGISEYGIYSLYLYQFNLVSSICFGWINQSELRYGSSGGKNDSEYLPKIIYIFILLSFTSALFLFIFNQTSFFLAIFSVFSIGVFSYLKTIFQSKILPDTYTYFVFVQALLIICFPILFIVFWKNEINSLIMIFFTSLSYLLSSIIFFVSKFNFLKEKFFYKSNLSKISKWLKYGMPVSIWSSLGLLLPYLDRYYIAKYLDSEALGIYSSVNELSIRVFSFFIFPFIMALHPRIIKMWNNGKREKAIKAIDLSIKVVFLLLVVLLLVGALFNDFIFSIFKYAIPAIPYETRNIILPLVLTGATWQLSFLTHKMIELKEETHLMILFILFSVFINYIGNNFFLPTHGIIASAYTSLISASSYCLLSFLYYKINNH